MNAVKFQTYKAENLVIKKSPAYWDLKKKVQDHNLSFLKSLINLKEKII